MVKIGKRNEKESVLHTLEPFQAWKIRKSEDPEAGSDLWGGGTTYISCIYP